MSPSSAQLRGRRAAANTAISAAEFEDPLAADSAPAVRSPAAPTGLLTADGASAHHDQPAGHDAGEVSRSTQEIVRSATRGRGGLLPFADRIQAAFGDHDVSGVR